LFLLYFANLICSGSTATIVRMPFINGLNDIDDFLYSTIDVAIWSTCETGIGLATSAVATLRPLLRQVFGEISITGSSKKPSRMWGGGYGSRSGYRPHPSQGDNIDISLTDHDMKRNHVHVSSGPTLSRTGSTAGLTDWELEKSSDKKSSTELTQPSGMGIMKTVNITQS
jgi:hypothetical protein